MRIAVIAVAIVIVSSPSHASPSCMTQAEARQKLGAAHLYWHGPGHCWDATPPRHRLAKRARTKEQRSVERDAPERKKPASWTHERRWREAMSEMLLEDAPSMRTATQARASSEPGEAPPRRSTWLDRWVDIVQPTPPIVDKSEPADLLPAPARTVEPMVTPTHLILAFLAVLLTLAVIEILFRTTIPEWRR
jgi:hypothetical protein